MYSTNKNFVATSPLLEQLDWYEMAEIDLSVCVNTAVNLASGENIGFLKGWNDWWCWWISRRDKDRLKGPPSDLFSVPTPERKWKNPVNTLEIIRSHSISVRRIGTGTVQSADTLRTSLSRVGDQSSVKAPPPPTDMLFFTDAPLFVSESPLRSIALRATEM